MKTFTAIIFAIILLLASISTSSVFAQDGGDEGYLVDEGYPVETAESTSDPSVPTPEPPQPTPEATEAAPLPAVSTPEPTAEPEDPHPVCEDLQTHPVLTLLAEHYNVAYEELLVYFCDYNLGVGEIDLLLKTFRRMSAEITLDEILAMRMDEGLGWGEIWLALGLKGGEVGNSDNQGHPAAFKKNENRAKYNHQASNAGEDNQLTNEFMPESPPGQNNNPNSNKPATPPGQDKGNDGKDPPGNTKRP